MLKAGAHASEPDWSRSWSRRLLSLAGDTADTGARLHGFTRALLLYSAARSWIAAIRFGSAESPLLFILAGALTIACALAFTTRDDLRRLSVRGALVALAVHLAATFPSTDNHFFLELCCFIVLACLEGALALETLRFVIVIVLFHTGLQKLLWGHYWHGDFLAFMVATGSPFGDLFGLILPASEVSRLRGMNLLVDGAGPFRVASIPLRLASNAVVLAELALPFLLIFRRTRSAAACAALALVAALQLGAREVLFFALFSTGLCLFLPRDPLPRALPFLAAFYLLLVGLALGVVPDLGLLRGGHL
jgi:hypothetical protein